MRAVKGGIELDIIVTPGAKKSTISGIDKWRERLIVRVNAPPSKGKANEAVCELLASLFKVKTQIIRGATARQKTVFLPSHRGRSSVAGGFE